VEADPERWELPQDGRPVAHLLGRVAKLQGHEIRPAPWQVRQQLLDGGLVELGQLRRPGQGYRDLRRQSQEGIQVVAVLAH
jgi:hypothetical protein